MYESGGEQRRKVRQKTVVVGGLSMEKARDIYLKLLGVF